jgi:quinoprotein glucose dehydrogenase
MIHRGESKPTAGRRILGLRAINVLQPLHRVKGLFGRRNHPALKGLNIPRTGQSGYVGVLVTKTLVIAAEPQMTASADHPRGAMLRAYNKANGNEVGAVWMPAPQSGTPMTYLADGKQYIIVPVSGANYSGESLAYWLPD